MNLVDAASLMGELADGISGARAEVGLTERRHHNDAFLKLTSLSDPELYAIISTNGSGTYGLEVTGGFCTGNTDDLSLDYKEVREYVESYVRAAIAYLDGHWSIRKSRVFKVPSLTIRTDAARLNLALQGHWSTNDARQQF